MPILRTRKVAEHQHHYTLAAARRFIAIDPGEVWCGVARYDVIPLLNTREQTIGIEVRADCRVLHVPSRGLYLCVMEALWALPATVIVEDYRVRPVGHARFHGGDTLRLIGALEMQTACSRGSVFTTVAAGSAEKELPQLTQGAFDRWGTYWPKPTHKNWNHARSAWRVLLRHLMQHDATLLRYLHDPVLQATFTAHAATFPLAHRHADDLLAPGGLWRHQNPDFGEALAPSVESV